MEQCSDFHPITPVPYDQSRTGGLTPRPVESSGPGSENDQPSNHNHLTSPTLESGGLSRDLPRDDGLRFNRSQASINSIRLRETVIPSTLNLIKSESLI